MLQNSWVGMKRFCRPLAPRDHAIAKKFGQAAHSIFSLKPRTRASCGIWIVTPMSIGLSSVQHCCRYEFTLICNLFPSKVSADGISRVRGYSRIHTDGIVKISTATLDHRIEVTIHRIAQNMQPLCIVPGYTLFPNRTCCTRYRVPMNCRVL